MLFVRKEVTTMNDLRYLVRQKGVEDVVFSDFYSAFRYYDLALKFDFTVGRSFLPQDDYYIEMILVSYPYNGDDFSYINCLFNSKWYLKFDHYVGRYFVVDYYEKRLKRDFFHTKKYLFNEFKRFKRLKLKGGD